MREEENMVQEGAPEEGEKKERGRSLKRAAEFVRNSTVAVLRGEFLIRLRFDRYFLHIIYIFFLFVMAIWMKLEIEQTMAVMEENRERVMDYRIYHAQKTYEAVKLDRLTTVQTMLQEKGSALTIPDRPADVIKEK